MIGNTVTASQVDSLYAARPNVDFSKMDYAFYDRLRRNRAQGYELGGLFAQPICRIMQSFVFGKGVTVTVAGDASRYADEVNRRCADFLSEHLFTLSEWYYDGSTLGDGYLAANPDGSLAQVSPEQVTPEYNPLDYRKLDKLTINTNIPGKTTATITDVYTAANRTLTTKLGTADAVTQVFRNPIGAIPVLHYPHGRSANEVFGHSVLEALLFALARYDNVTYKAITGVERMGNPIPVAEGLVNPEAEKEANSTGTSEETLVNGDTVTVHEMDFSQVNMLWLGEGGSFKFAAPPSFTGDTTAMLQILFYLILEHTGIIEGVWGTAMNSSHASLDAQMPAFNVTIQRWQQAFTPFLKAALRTWLAWQGVTDARLRLAPQVPLQVTWGSWLETDATLLFQKVKYAEEANLLPRAMALQGLDLAFVEDPQGAVEQADQEAQERNPFGNTEAQIDQLAAGENPDVQGDSTQNGQPRTPSRQGNRQMVGA